MGKKIIRTVQGDIAPEALGYCQCHEHLFIAKGISGEKVPSLIMEDLDKTTEELTMYYNKGGRAVVDAQPIGCGRMAKELLQASINSGVHVIGSTGFHKLDFYDDNHFVYQLEEDQLADLFITELSQGMFIDQVNGPNVPKVIGKAKAGMIKCASDGKDIRKSEGNLPIYRKLFTAAGKAAKAMNAPIMTHLEMSRGAESQFDILTSQGVAPNRIIMSHLDRVINDEIIDYQLEVAKSGVFLQFDTIGRYKYHSDEEEARFIAMLCEKGFEKQIVIGLDTTNERLKSYGGSLGLDYILEKFRNNLRIYGVNDELFHQFTISNPMQAICFEHKN